MSIPVDLPKLADVLARYRFAYLLTSSERGAPHAVAATPGACGSDCVEIAT